MMKTSETSQKTGSPLRQFVSLFVLPAIGLSLVSYRILGKRCTYRWGNLEVTPLEPINRGEYLFTRLFPSGVVLFGVILLMGVSYLLGLPSS